MGEVAGLLSTGTFAEGVSGAHDHPDALADGGYRLCQGGDHPLRHEERGTDSVRKGIRINCTGPGVTETPILDQLRTKYGQEYLDDIPKPLGRVSNPTSRPPCWCS